ncbi:MAG: hypothetical protein MI785_08000 [Kiloniellales bacterium]|nr:hypothetical protein [Kiloniellales bacterium]
MIEWIDEFWIGLEASLNPYSEQQLTLFFTWLVVFTTSSVALIMADRRWLRLLAWVVCTCSSFGLWQAGWITLTIATSYWPAALAVVGTTAAGSFWFGRRRRRIQA